MPSTSYQYIDKRRSFTSTSYQYIDKRGTKDTKGSVNIINLKQTDNAMAKNEKDKQTTTHTTQHRKLKNKQHEPRRRSFTICSLLIYGQETLVYNQQVTNI